MRQSGPFARAAEESTKNMNIADVVTANLLIKGLLGL
jgi:hypothetical protein